MDTPEARRALLLHPRADLRDERRRELLDFRLRDDALRALHGEALRDLGGSSGDRRRVRAVLGRFLRVLVEADDGRAAVFQLLHLRHHRVGERTDVHLLGRVDDLRRADHVLRCGQLLDGAVEQVRHRGLSVGGHGNRNLRGRRCRRRSSSGSCARGRRGSRRTARRERTIRTSGERCANSHLNIPLRDNELSSIRGAIDQRYLFDEHVAEAMNGVVGGYAHGRPSVSWKNCKRVNWTRLRVHPVYG